MARFYGPIGFATETEASPGVWKKRVEERNYSGDLKQYSRQTQSSGQFNDNFNLTTEISVISDPYADANLYSICYVIFRGAKWKVTGVRPEHPRIILTIGGLYNG